MVANLQVSPAPRTATADFRTVRLTDLDALIALEQECFETDRLNKRQFIYWIKSDHRVFVVAELNDEVVAYGLVIMRKGTRLARVYSIAVGRHARGAGIGRQLMEYLEQGTLSFGKFFLRLEVSEANQPAISLYESLGYIKFGMHSNYYDDHSNALRMQKDIKQADTIKRSPPYPWYQQTTEFTCGPAALMMAMASLRSQILFSQALELALWREATTIFMMAGHGGCHPIGLGLAAARRDFQVEIYVNQPVPLFINGVRSEHKRQILSTVEQDFLQQAQDKNIPVIYQEFTVVHLREALKQGKKVLSLISTYQFDGHKIPHWVTITGCDEECLYLHDPDGDKFHVSAMDCQHIPVAIDDFFKLSSYGKARLRTAVVIANNE